MNTKTRQPLARRFPPAGRIVSGLLIVISAFIWPAVRLAGQSLHERILADEMQDRANEIIRKERALRSMQQGPSDSRDRDNSSSRAVDRGPSESALKAEKVNGIMNLARAASTRGDLREALRLAREAQPIAQSPKFKGELNDWIQALEAAIARDEAWKAADALRVEGNAAGARGDLAEALRLYHRALATDPNCLSEDGKKWVRDLETRMGAVNTMQQTLDTFAQTLRPAPVSGALDFVAGETLAVDARNVHSGLPKSVEEAIPHTPAGDRVRKGFQAITEHDWAVAKAWFEDALNHQPGDAGLQRLVDLAQHTLQKQTAPVAEVAPADAAAMDRIFDDLLRQDFLQHPNPARPPETLQEKYNRILDDRMLQDLIQEHGQAQYAKQEKEKPAGQSASAIEYADTFMLLHDPVSWRKVHPDWWKDIPEMVALHNRPPVYGTAPDGSRVQLPTDADILFLFDSTPSPEKLPVKAAVPPSGNSAHP